MLRIPLIILAAVVSTGCAKSVVEMGSGKYYQEATSVDAASRNAREFCAKKGKEMDPIQVNPSNQFNNTEMIFVCK